MRKHSLKKFKNFNSILKHMVAQLQFTLNQKPHKNDNYSLVRA